MVKLVGFVGSLRTDSCNRKLAEAAIENAPEGVSLELFEQIERIPFYNEDIDVEGLTPAVAARLRDTASEADGLIVFSPEYNGTMPATVKNVIDWLSRPYGKSAITGKPLAVVGAAHGRYGGVWAHDDIRRSAGVAGAKVLNDLALSIAHVAERFAEVPPAQDHQIVSELRSILSELADLACSSSA
ncbi:NAD(P)H-dependent oxidoreductase [Mycobacteroides abscessus]|uniref:NAD(P)H-dependent oxidoreductase n=1 Tax=Mycobacteroides abscessus TaxID=36809 RepID=UPI001F32F1E8|nr:NAD(P)H-dependent oxidoreductase [Mycobacteroides abscessus]